MKWKSNTELRYYERQHFAAWVYLLLGAIITGAGLSFTGMNLPEDKQVLIMVLLITGTLGALTVAINVFRMHTELRQDSLYIHFGIFFPMIWKTIPLDDIVEIQSVTYRPLLDAGGWGWRMGRFEKTSTVFYNAKGNQGVLLITRDNHHYIIGSQEPARFESSLRKVCNNL